MPFTRRCEKTPESAMITAQRSPPWSEKEPTLSLDSKRGQARKAKFLLTTTYLL